VAFRAAAPQIVQPHVVLARCRELLYTGPAIVARTHEIIRNHGSGPPMTQPTRDQLLTALEPAA
jgi:hypothetical protein